MNTIHTSADTKHTRLVAGQRGTSSGFPCTVVRHYSGDMYEFRMPGGLVCFDAFYFIPDKAVQ